MDRDDLLQRATEFYLTSRDFNGLPIRSLIGEVDLDTVRSCIRDGVQDGLITIVFGDVHPNPHIKALIDEPKEATLEKLDTPKLAHACLYPTRKHLETVVDTTKYSDAPYALELALGEAQLDHRSFDLHALEPYRNDPRYWYDSDDIVGQIYVQQDSEGIRDEEDVYLRFGFSYDGEENRYVAMFLWDLFKLPPQAQQLWQMREVNIPTILHPEYFRTQIIGDWPQHLSIFEAFTLELETINAMAEAMGRPKLFREDYRETRPRGFGSLLRPTLRELNDFIRLLDSMISDNIDTKFFKKEVSSEKQVERKDGKIQVERKGTLQMLQEWVETKFSAKEPEPMQEIFTTFREIRKLRSKPSHKAVEDQFSLDIAKQQRDLMREAYVAVRTLRLLFANHPAAKSVEVFSMLYEGKIWDK
jgi:hypothetical protein